MVANSVMLGVFWQSVFGEIAHRDEVVGGMGHYFSAVGKANGAAGSKCHCIIIKAFIAITILIIVADIISPSPSSLPMSPPSSHPSSNHHLIVIIIITTII